MRVFGLFLAMLFLSPLVAIACGGDSGGDDDPTATPAPFNRELLTAAVLRPDDLGPDYLATGQYATGIGAIPAQSFTTISTDGARRVHTTTVHYRDRAKQREDWVDDRASLVAFKHTESNYQIAGADQAFFYRTPDLPTLSMWALKDEYIVFLQTSVLVNRDDAIDRETFDRLAALLMERVVALDADPAGVTPMPELVTAPDMSPDVTATPASAATPEPTVAP